MEKRKKVPKSEPQCVIEVQAIPRSSKILIERTPQNHYKVKLTSPPVDGLANEQLTETIAVKIGVSRRNVEIISGLHSRKKRVRIHGFDEQTVRALLDPTKE